MLFLRRVVSNLREKLQSNRHHLKYLIIFVPLLVTATLAAYKIGQSSSVAKASSLDGNDTMIALDPLYQMNMGQYADLSFHDRKIINLAYCSGICATPLTQSCQRGGYQNPNNCSSCICPGGFSGQYCDEIAQPQNANCGGILNIASGTQQVIKSPGYDTTGYSEQQECTWWIKAQANYTLELEFSGSFGIACNSVSACAFHWVEIKYKKDLGSEGARFCCYDRPTDILISESNEMMVVFRSNYSISLHPLGFEASIKSIPPTTSSSSPTSTPASTKTTSTSTATKTSATTLAPITNGRSLFRCSFETTSRSADTLCGMTQDTTDQFDWTVYHDPTPSESTGPDSPFAGDLYIYIEASEPRQPNDTARLFFPKMNFTGEVCVDFWHHMFGFHINTLKLMKITSSQSTDIWSKTGQIGNFWLYASVGVHLSTNTQLQFIGIRGEEYSGDIGLDRVEVRSGPCCDV